MDGVIEFVDLDRTTGDLLLSGSTNWCVVWCPHPPLPRRHPPARRYYTHMLTRAYTRTSHPL